METDTTKPLVLLVDDTPANLDIVSEALADSYEVSVAMDGESALEIVREFPPDLILLDVMMPGMDGYEVCRRLKTDDRTANIPVLFLTALSDDEDEAKGLALGAVDYISKPFNPGLVKARVQNHLALVAARRTVEQQRDDISQAYADLKELEELRDGLAHMIIHDMGSPLMAICGGLQIVEHKSGTKLPESELRLLRNALGSAERMSEMVRSLLDINRLESGRLPLDRQPHDLGKIIGQARDRLSSMLLDHPLECLDPASPVSCTCDHEIMVRVVVNLLSNAIKYTPKGCAIQVSYTAEESTVILRVRDHGPGIPPEFIDRIFDKFGQVKSHEKSGYHSAGLGLTFCKLALEAHGGDVWVESELGDGATFVAKLPIQPPAENNSATS